MIPRSDSRDMPHTPWPEVRRFDLSLSYLDKVIASKPMHADAFLQRGITLRNMGRLDEALANYNTAMTLCTPDAQTHLSRGNLLALLRQPQEALEDIEKALALRAGFAEAFVSRANILYELKRYDDAENSYKQALSHKPDYAEAYYNLGTLQMNLKRFDAALISFAKTIAINRDYKYAKGQHFFLKMFLCNWRDYSSLSQGILEDIRRNKLPAMPFPVLAMDSTGKDQLICNKNYAAAEHPAFSPLWKGEIYSHSKIRIAYLSADYQEHATAYLMAGLFENHDKSRFEITALSFGKNDNSPMRHRLVTAFDHFIDVSQMTDTQVAQMIREREIDIAVDLKGFTLHNRAGILAHRPAPVQVSYLGYPSTMGVDFIDYIIADNTIIPAEHEPYYSEKIIRLPDTYQPNDSRREISPHTPSRAELGLPENGVVFCSFNNSYKITPQMFDIWMRLLKNTQGSVLWLLQSTDTSTDNLRREAELRGISSDRIIFATHMKLNDHLARYRHADLFLDTSPYNAHTTASDALWVGVPIVTYLGQTFASRVAGSLLNAAGMPELITHSMKDYEALALKIAHDPELLSSLKDKISAQRNTCPLFDTALYSHHLDEAYIQMHKKGTV